MTDRHVKDCAKVKKQCEDKRNFDFGLWFLHLLRKCHRSIKSIALKY